MIENLKLKIENFVLDTLFPISCISCGKKDVWLCESCFSQIKILPSQVCPYCEKTISSNGATCAYCRSSFLSQNDKFFLDNLIVSSRYKEISSAVHLFKYNFVKDFSVPIGKILIKSYLSASLSLPDLIVPVPLHPRRLRWRGFNQSELLAEYMSENIAPGISIPVFSDLITRKKYTAPQMKIRDYKKRKENISNAFAFSEKCSAREKSEIFQGKNILLIDDIATTGSTLFECAKVLKKNGAQKVFAAVIARQEFS